MPEKVDECVESILNDDSNDINDKSTAYAICNAQFNKADEMPTLVETILFEADIPEKFVTEGTGLSEERTSSRTPTSLTLHKPPSTSLTTTAYRTLRTNARV